MVKIITSFLCLIFLAFSTVHGEPQDTCKKLKCGDKGPAVHFPFSLKGRHPDHCVFPGFVLSCNEKHETILELPIPFKFPVKSIDYKAQAIQLYDPESCLLVKLLKVFNKSISPFHFSKNYMTDLTLFNCSLAERQLDEPVPCFSGPGYQVYSVVSSKSIRDLPLLSCTKMYNLSSVPYFSYEPANLYLEWSEPNCGQCEARGKMCRLKNNGTKSEIECVDFSKAGMANINFSLVHIYLTYYRFLIFCYTSHFLLTHLLGG